MLRSLPGESETKLVPTTPVHNKEEVEFVSPIFTFSEKKKLQVLSTEWDCVRRDCNGYLTLYGYVDANGDKTIMSCHCSAAASKGYGNCDSRYIIAKWISTCKLCKCTVKPVSCRTQVCC